MHVHHVPHAEYVKNCQSDKMPKYNRDDVSEDLQVSKWSE